jgi:type III secretory pathway component EscU
MSSSNCLFLLSFDPLHSYCLALLVAFIIIIIIIIIVIIIIIIIIIDYGVLRKPAFVCELKYDIKRLKVK